MRRENFVDARARKDINRATHGTVRIEGIEGMVWGNINPNGSRLNPLHICLGLGRNNYALRDGRKDGYRNCCTEKELSSTDSPDKFFVHPYRGSCHCPSFPVAHGDSD